MTQQLISTTVGSATGAVAGGTLINANFAEVYAIIQQTNAEILATITPTNTGYLENDIRRYGSGVGTGNSTTDLAAWIAAHAVAAQNKRPVHLSGLALTFATGISWDYASHGLELENASITFTSAATSGWTISTTNGSYVSSYTRGAKNFTLLGPLAVASITFTGTLAAAATSATLNANFTGPTGTWPVTFLYGVTFTIGPSSGATSATLTSNFTGQTGPYVVTFSDSETRTCTLTNGATTCTWSGGLTNTVTASATTPIDTRACAFTNGATTCTWSGGLSVAATAAASVATCTIDGITFGAGGSAFGASALIDGFYIAGFRRAITWSNNSWLNRIGSGEIQSCIYGPYYPSGLLNSGENILFGDIVVANCYSGIYCNDGTMNFKGLSLDYNLLKSIEVHSNGDVRASDYHLESNFDNDYYLFCADAGSIIELGKGDIYYNSTKLKTQFPIGICGNSGSANINFVGELGISNFTESNYGFNFLVDGQGDCQSIAFLNQTSGSGTTAVVPFSKCHSILLDGAFAQSTVIDWMSAGSGNQAAISASQSYTAPASVLYAPVSTQSMAQPPGAGQVGYELLNFACSPGDQPIFAIRAIFSGTASTDVLYIVMSYIDENGNSLSANQVSRNITTLPASITRYSLSPFGPAPSGTAYCEVQLQKRGPSSGNSDGNGTIYWMDGYLYCKTGMRMPINSQLSIVLGAHTSAFTIGLLNCLGIDGLRIKNTTANAITGGLKIGSTSGATDVAAAITSPSSANINASADIFVPGMTLAKQYLSGTGKQTFYIDAVTSWNSASILVTVFTRKVICGGY